MPTLAVSHAPFMTTKDDFRPRRETKSVRKNFNITPTAEKLLSFIADREGTSENDAVALAIEGAARALPLLGEIHCGPMSSIPEEIIERWVNVGDLLKVRTGDFLLTARGSSMTGEGIFEGDLVQIRPQDSCDSGDVAAVLVDTPLGTQATLKKVQYTNDSPIIKLVPMNPDHPVIEVDTTKEKLRICGVKRGVIRMH